MRYTGSITIYSLFAIFVFIGPDPSACRTEVLVMCHSECRFYGVIDREFFLLTRIADMSVLAQIAEIAMLSQVAAVPMLDYQIPENGFLNKVDSSYVDLLK